MNQLIFDQLPFGLFTFSIKVVWITQMKWTFYSICYMFKLNKKKIKKLKESINEGDVINFRYRPYNKAQCTNELDIK